MFSPTVSQIPPAMSATKHTPGQWHVGGRDRCTVYDRFDQRIANSFERVMVTHRSDAECRANARLIAAAPELLALAQQLAALRDGLNNGSSAAEERAARLAERAHELVAKINGGAA